MRGARGCGGRPYIKAGPATRGGGGEAGRGRGKRPAAPLISTRWSSPPGTSDMNGEGGRGGACFPEVLLQLLRPLAPPLSLSGIRAVPEAACAIGPRGEAPPP